MGTVYSARLYGGQIVAAGESDLFVVPVGMIAVVRDISITNVTPNDSDQVLVYVLITGGNADIFRAPAVPSHGFIQWQGRQVVNAGETLAFYATDTTVRVMISGYLLSSP